MTTALSKPVRRRVGSIVVEVGETGLTFRAPGCRRRVFLPYAEAIEAALDLAGYPPREGDPRALLRRLRKRSQGQPRNLFSAAQEGPER